MPRYAHLASATLVSAVLATSPVGAQTSCSASQDTCDGTHSSLFAIAHDHTDPSNILYRVNLPEQPTGTGWGDGMNGFVYQTQTEADGNWNTVVPFNGIGNSEAGVPMLRPFSFIVPMAKGSSMLSVRACALRTNANDEVTDCTKVLWTDSYSSLPSPTVGSDRVAPASLPNGFDLEFVSESIQVRNNGVYAALVTLKPTVNNVETSLTQDQIDWLYDHIVFLDDNRNVFDNDLFPGQAANTAPFAALKIKEAGYPEKPGSSYYLVKYSDSNTAVQPTEPGAAALLQFWVYSTDTTTSEEVQLSAGWLYDASADCPGALSGDANSLAASCTVDTAPDTGLLPYVDVVLLSGSSVSSTSKANNSAGDVTVRNVGLSVADSHAMCTHAVNPLAAYSNSAINLPNYVLDASLANDSWTGDLPPALYYVTPSGFGNCDTDNMPFCNRTDSYAAYIPHYLDTSNNGGSLNGGGTAERLVGSFNLADQYAIHGLSNSGTNYLAWFDNCGYGHEFTDDGLSKRLTSLPSAPFNRSYFNLSIANAGSQALVLAKDCCASFYQALQCSGTDSKGNPSGCTYRPPQQIGQGFGMLLPQRGEPQSPVIDVEYESLFPAEAFTVYGAASGELLYRLISRDTGQAPQIQSCPDSRASLTFDSSASPQRLSLYDDATSGSTKCTGPPKCPYSAGPLTFASNGKTYNACVVRISEFLLNLDIWASQADVAGAEGVIVTAWGAYGYPGEQGNPDRDQQGYGGGHPGHSGYAQTIMKPGDLPKYLYSYVAVVPDVADLPKNHNYGHGGASTILSTIPLSSLDPDVWANGSTIDNGRVLLIGGGGGGGGFGSPAGAAPAYQGGFGGNGGFAAANASPPSSGGAVSAAGTAGHYKGQEQTGGPGGNGNGQGEGGNWNTGTGVGGFSGSGEGWSHNGSLIPPSKWTSGTGAPGSAGGGGGFGGGANGGKEHTWASGAGGGGSWAKANTVSLATVPNPSTLNFNSGGGAVAFSYASPCNGNCMAVDAVPVDGIPRQSCITTEHKGTLIQSQKASLDWSGDGNLELRSKLSGDQLWHAGTVGQGHELCFAESGKVTISDMNGVEQFSRGTSGSRFLILNGCTLSLVDGNGNVDWEEDHDLKC